MCECPVLYECLMKICISLLNISFVMGITLSFSYLFLCDDAMVVLTDKLADFY